MKRLIVMMAVVAVGACSLDKQAAPALTGPSELGLSLTITATPDAISQDGHAQSTIQVTAHDANNLPVRGLSLRADIFVGGVEADLGTLSSKSLSTDNNGQATAIYTAPPAPPPTASADAVVTVSMTPVGTNFANETPQSVDIRLARTGTIVPPGAAPTAVFVFSPAAPRTNDSILFDASQSTGTIASYAWTFGDGGAASGQTSNHSYVLAGTYSVQLTVIDTLGRTASTTSTVTVTNTANPVASFTVSPTDPLTTTTVNFDGSASTAQPGHLITSYAWDFGDGSFCSGGQASCSGNGQDAHHVYGQASTYTVVLTVTDETGHTGVTSQTVTVK